MKESAMNPFKPDFREAARRWEAFLAGDIIDRPLLCARLPKADRPPVHDMNYHEKFLATPEAIVERSFEVLDATHFLGEAIPTFSLSFGCDELAVFCGGPDMTVHPDSGDTCWMEPFVTDWERSLPIVFRDDHPLWRKTLACWRLARERNGGRAAMGMLDPHSNLGLLAAMRGAQNLCMDCADRPELIDRAMESARRVFPHVWNAIREAGGHDEAGYSYGVYSPRGACMLECDFSCMISPAMFRRWVVPALEEEAAWVRNVCYHWDGVGALVHADDIVRLKGIYTLSFLPGAGNGRFIEFNHVHEKCQAAGKAVHVAGTVEECKAMHRRLKPNLTIYYPQVDSVGEFHTIEKWFRENT